MTERFFLQALSGDLALDPDTAQAHELLGAVEALGDDTARIDAFAWLLGWIGTEAVQASLVRLLATEEDALTLAGMIDALETLARMPQAFCRAAWEALWPRFEARSEHPWMRCQALRGGLMVVQGEPSLVRRLQACILDVDFQDDGTYLRHVAKVAGAILRRYPDEDFRALLLSLAKIETAADEATLELGLDRLQAGLLAQTRDEVSSALGAALAWFRCALENSENRVDAKLYERSTLVLIEAHQQGLSANLEEHLPVLRRAAFSYSAYAKSAHSPTSWLRGASDEASHWLSMATRLATLGRTFTKDIWLHAALVIEEELLAIFEAGERLFGRPEAGGMTLLGRDALLAALHQRSYYLQAIDQWLAENEDHAAASAVGGMRESIRQSVVDRTHRRPFDDAVGHRIADLLIAAGADEATAAMTAAQLEISADRNQQLSSLWLSLMADLSDCPDMARSVPKALLATMCTLLLRFLDHRANVGTATDPSGEYVFRRGGDLPLEHALQLDFLRFLSANDTPSFQAEARDKGGGRSDIAISFRGLETIVEVKKDDHVPDNAVLARRYAGQATGYLTTGIRFGFLLVLDLTDRGGHQPNISEQISVERKFPQGSNVEYHVITARIQGKRKTPHALR